MDRIARAARLAALSLRMLAVLVLICGGAYTLAVTGIAQAVFPHRAGGSLIEADGRVLGSELIGQPFSGPGHLWGRVPSLSVVRTADGGLAVTGTARNVSPSGVGPDAEGREAFGDEVAERVRAIRAATPERGGEPVPVDLVTASASGVDPDISLAAARYQIPRIARETGRSEEEVSAIIDASTRHRILGVVGEEVVNVLEVNLRLDGVIG